LGEGYDREERWFGYGPASYGGNTNVNKRGRRKDQLSPVKMTRKGPRWGEERKNAVREKGPL